MENKRCSGLALGLGEAIAILQFAWMLRFAWLNHGALALLVIPLCLAGMVFVPRDLSSGKARGIQRADLIVSAICAFALLFPGLPRAVFIICLAFFSFALSNLGTAIHAMGGASQPDTPAFFIKAGIIGAGLAAMAAGESHAAEWHGFLMASSVVLPAGLFGCLIYLERFAFDIELGHKTGVDGRAAVFDGQRYIRFYSLFKMNAPRMHLVLGIVFSLGLGLMARSVLAIPSLICLFVAFGGGGVFFALMRKRIPRELFLIICSAFVVVAAIVALISVDEAVNAFAFALMGFGLSGVVGLGESYYLPASRSLRVLLGGFDTSLLSSTGVFSSALGFCGGLLISKTASLGDIWTLAGSIVIFLGVILSVRFNSQMLQSLPELEEYLSSDNRSPVRHEALARSLIRRPDMHKRPPFWLYFLAGLVLIPMCRLRYGMRAVKKVRIKRPALILTNHTSNLDYLFVASACWPVRINFLATYYWFTFKKLRPWLRYMGVIQKYQFATDITAMKKLRYVIQEKRSVTFIAPEGTIYANGRSGPISDSIVKVIRFLGVPVYAMKIEGAGLGHGKWQKVRQKNARVDVSVSPLLSGEEVRSLDGETMYRRIVEALRFDDFEFQRRTGIKIHGDRKAEGLDDLIYKCPQCGCEFTLKTEGNRIFCTDCGLEAVMNDSYRFDWPMGRSWFDNYSEWYDWQYDELCNQMLSDPDFEMKAEVDYGIDIVDTDGYVNSGEGVLSLSLRHGWVYRGTLLGRQVVEHDSLASVPVAIMKMGHHIELPFKEHSRRFEFKEDGRYSQKWHIASRIISEKRLWEREERIS